MNSGLTASLSSAPLRTAKLRQMAYGKAGRFSANYKILVTPYGILTGQDIVGLNSQQTSERIGYLAGASFTTGTGNVAIGCGAMQNLAVGYSNVAVGQNAMLTANSTNNHCVAIGKEAASSATSDQYTVVGADAGTGRATMTGCVLIGYGANTSATGVINTIAIGRNSTATAAAQFVAGSSSYPINNVYFGKGVTNATATTYTINGTGGTGTDNAGAGIVIAGGASTGTAAGGFVATSTSLSSTTGSTANNLSTRSYASAKTVDLTESTATTFANIALAASKFLGGKLICTVTATDGTDCQALTSDIIIAAVNKTGTVTATINQVDGTTAASAGTLTCTYTIAANANSVDIKANAVSSLTQTSLKIKWMIVALNTDDVGTVTAS